MEQERKIAIPTVHLNGSGAQDLFDRNLAAIQAVDIALEKLVDARPHPRDFYVQNPDNFEQAREEHNQRIKMLSLIKEDLQNICFSIVDQAPKKVKT